MALLEQIGRTDTGSDLVRIVCALDSEALRDAGDKQGANEQWVHILPSGAEVHARDGRSFTVDDLAAVIRASELPMLVDWEHASEDGDTRASGWIEELRVDDGATDPKRAGTWGRVRWTPKGRGDVADQHYRFLSPVVVGKKRNSASGKALFAVERIASVALTNRPALSMTGIEALREQLSVRVGRIATDDEEQPMSALQKAVRQAYGLRDDATEDQLTEAFERGRGQGGESATLREALANVTTERNAAQAKLTETEKELETFRAQTFRADVEAFFAEGARKGKIPPAAKEKWLKFALDSSEKFETFKSLIYPDLPVIGEPAPPGKKAKGAAPARAGLSENGVDRGALKRLGFSEKQIAEAEADVFGGDPVSGPGDEDDDEDDEGDDDDDNPSPNDDAGGKEGASP